MAASVSKFRSPSNRLTMEMSKDAALTASIFSYVHRQTLFGRTVHLTDPTAQEPHTFTQTQGHL